MDRRAASYVSDQLVYEEFQPVEAPPPSLGAKDPFQREVRVGFVEGKRAWKREDRTVGRACWVCGRKRELEGKKIAKSADELSLPAIEVFVAELG